ncbi:MAG: hypothetical protein LBP50_07770 [Tannerella sp.]|jgi:hypothetical protein|nr:hypothetical protein [Tannerella sp.]
MWKKIIILSGFMLVLSTGRAQQKLSVDTLFNEYGLLHGSVMITLGKDVLGNHTLIDEYKCLMMQAESEPAQRIETAIRRDYERRERSGKGTVIKEIRRNGHLRNASYALGKDRVSSVAEYILYSRHDNKITLVYLSGSFPAGQLDGELNKLKNLFIKINRK